MSPCHLIIITVYGTIKVDEGVLHLDHEYGLSQLLAMAKCPRIEFPSQTNRLN